MNESNPNDALIIEEKAPVTNSNQNPASSYAENLNTIEKLRDTSEVNKEVVERLRAIHDSVPETEEILYNERPPRDDKEMFIASHELEISGLKQEAENYRQKNNFEGESLARLTIAFKEAQLEFFKLYFDALDKNKMLAGYLLADFENALGEQKNSGDEKEVEVDFVV